jgi:hypothetical protein
MCQGEIEKLCIASQSWHGRKVARLLARPLSRRSVVSVASVWYQNSKNPAYLSQLGRADERTRTADPISLRVIHHAMQRVARGCKPRISRGVSLLRVAS